MRFMSFDISSVSTGVAVVDMKPNGELTVVFTTNIITNSKDKTGKRLRIFAEAMTGLLSEFKPDYIIKEMTIARMATQHIQLKFFAAFELVLELEDYPKFYEYAPTTVKKVVANHGRASKAEVAAAIKSYTDVDTEDMTDDETDAIAIALTHIGKTATLVTREDAREASEHDALQAELMEEVADEV